MSKEPSRHPMKPPRTAPTEKEIECLRVIVEQGETTYERVSAVIGTASATAAWNRCQILHRLGLVQFYPLRPTETGKLFSIKWHKKEVSNENP
jgi:hypothetical protein